MDNFRIARIFTAIGDLLKIKNANPFKIRAYHNAADIVRHMAERVADLTEAEVLELPGVGKDLAARVHELVDTDALAYYDELRKEFPPTILDLLRLQGVGPKTVAMLYGELGLETLDDLETAATEGRLRALKGMGPKKKEQLLLRSIAEHRRQVGRHLLGHADQVATRVIDYLRVDGITLLAGIECDVRADGTLDLAEDCLAATVARRAWAEPDESLNTRPLETFRTSLRRHRNGRSTSARSLNPEA